MKWKHQFIAAVLSLLVLFSLSHSVPAQVPEAAQNEPATVTVIASGEKAVTVDVEVKPPFIVTFGLDRISTLQQKYAGIPLWQYISSLIYILVAFGVSKLLDFVLQAWLQKWASRTKTKLDNLVLDVLHGPVKVVSFVIFLHIGIEVLPWPAWAEGIMRKTLGVIVAISLTYMLMKIVDVAIAYWSERTRNETNPLLHQQLLPVIQKTAKVIILVLAVLLTAQTVFEKDVTALIAFGSIGGLALGLAGQDTLANLFGAVAVFVDRPFQIGDMIIIDGNQGTVESIGLRSTRLRNLDGHLITIPNKTMGNSNITNITRRPSIRTVMNIGVTYDTSPEKLREGLKILEDILRNHPMTGDLIISFNKFEASSLNIMVVHWWKGTDFRVYLAGIQEINLTIKERFENAGLDFAFPTQTIHFKPPEMAAKPAA